MRLANPFLHAIDRCYRALVKGSSNLQSLFLLYMRFTFGHYFILTGWTKLHSIEQTAIFFSSLHIAHPYFNAYLVGWTELLGGFCLFIGLAARLVSVSLMIDMGVALSVIHASGVFNIAAFLQPFYPIPLPYLFFIACSLIFTFGPGRISIDAWLKRWSEKQPHY